MKSYIPGLDGLRALAISTVFVGHAFPTIIANSVGVDIFFALSGFLITRGLIGQLESGRVELKQFYIRRALRLAPALILLVVILLVVAIILKLTINEHLRDPLVSSLVSLTYLMNWDRAFGLYPEGLLGHTWSLSIEEQFYLVWPIALISITRFRSLRIASRVVLILAVVSVAWRIYLWHTGATLDRVYNGFDTRADGLLVGCTLALARPFKMAEWAARFSAVPLLFILWLFIVEPWTSMQTLPPTIAALASAWLILPLWAGTAPRLSALLELWPIRQIGRISYGLYLWHWPALLIITRFIFPQNVLLTSLLCAVTTLIVATLSFVFIERPILERGQLRSREYTDRQVVAA
jgi:peptidoglycan/LPS O-acetylase OafA/YrhL